MNGTPDPRQGGRESGAPYDGSPPKVGVDPAQLVIEVTETAAISDMARSCDFGDADFGMDAAQPVLQNFG
jgi:hypothetical protein